MVRLKNKVMLLICSALTMHVTYAPVLVTGPVGTTSATTTSNKVIMGLKQHRASGTLVMTTSIDNSNNSIMLLSRPSTTDTAPTATGIAADTNLRSACIPNFAIVEDPTTPSNANLLKIAVTRSNTTRPTTVYLVTPTCGTAVIKAPLDAAGTPAATSNIVGLAGGNAGTTSCVFAAVKKNGSTGTNFGDTITTATGDGIAVLTVNNSTLAMTQVSSAAYALDTRITCSLSCGNSAGATATTSITVGTQIPMAYDADLQNLYVGMPNITTNNVSANKNNAGAYSIAIFDVNSTTGALTQMSPVATTKMTTVLGTASAQYIIGQRNSSGNTGKRLNATNIKVMTTSTGPSADVRFKYLIVNGGHGTSTGNQVWAIPLVVGNADATVNGAFAKVTTGNFGTAAAAAGDLYLTTSAAAKVGNGPLPILGSDTIADMQVQGDSVYVSLNTSQTAATKNPGLYVSQAIFDELGKVTSWTEWHKIAPNTLGNTEAAGRTGLFSVDGVTGHITSVDGVATTAVRMTQWQNTSYNQAGTASTIGLVTNLNKTTNVGDGCTAVCDLNSTTTAWGNVTFARMALFGGVNGKVCFAMTGSAVQRVASNALTTAVVSNTGCEQILDTSSADALDYTASTTLLLTNLPTGAGTVRALSHSGWYPNQTSTPSFFFAGAETADGQGGLYAYCAATLGAGSNQSTFKNFGVAPFRAHSWQQLTRCDGIPVKIETKGGAVYILTRKVDASGNPMDRIFRLTSKSTGATLNTNFIVTATAGAINGAVNLSAVKHIYDFVVSNTGTSLEQLTMLTNDGIYTTTCANGCDTAGFNNSPASAMLNCGWTKVTSPATAQNFMLKFFPQSHTRTPQTLTAAQWTPATDNANVYDTISLVQYGRATNRISQFGQDAMTNFNANNNTSTVPAAFVDLPVVTNFYSDGARRLLSSVSRSTSAHSMKLMSSPYRVDLWNLAAPYTVQDAAVQNLGAVYWMRPIAGTMMIGTSKGVVAQQ